MTRNALRCHLCGSLTCSGHLDKLPKERTDGNPPHCWDPKNCGGKGHCPKEIACDH